MPNRQDEKPYLSVGDHLPPAVRGYTMPIDYPAILNHVSAPQTWRWDERDAIVYALSVGLGTDPCDQRILPFVYERCLKILPTLPTVLAWAAEPTFTHLGADPANALHGEQKIELHSSLQIRPGTPLEVRVQGRVVEVYDKGADRGALIVTEHTVINVSDGQLIATLTTTCFGRSEGGCGGSKETAPRPHTIPPRPPDCSVEYPTRTDVALLYRLTGDRNPIHADPAVAHSGGFPRPILHGLCTFGMCCRAVLERYADYESERIASQQARFSSPVFPGETLAVDLWRDKSPGGSQSGGGDVISFQARVAKRNAVVLTNGRCILR